MVLLLFTGDELMVNISDVMSDGATVSWNSIPGKLLMLMFYCFFCFAVVFLKKIKMLLFCKQCTRILKHA